MKHRSCAIAALSVILLAIVGSIDCLAFKSGYGYDTIHRNIVIGALRKVGFSNESLEMIITGTDSQDDITSKKFTDSPTHHFDDNLINESISYFKERFSKAVHDSRDIYKVMGSKSEYKDRIKNVLYTFGEGLHTVQDFYSHSNYAEILAVSGDNDYIINWDNLPKGLKTGYFFWNGYTNNESTRSRAVCVKRIQESYRKKGQALTFHSEASWNKRKASKDFKLCTDYVLDPKIQCLHYELNKDRVKEYAGSVLMPDKRTMHDKARFLATLETRRQWIDFKKALGKKYGKKSQLIVPVLKGCSVPTIELTVDLPSTAPEGKGIPCQCKLTLKDVLNAKEVNRENPSKYDLTVRARIFRDGIEEAQVEHTLEDKSVGSKISISFDLSPLSGAGKRIVRFEAMYTADTKYNAAVVSKSLLIGDSKLLNSNWLIEAYFGGKMGTRKYSVKVLDDRPTSFTVRVLGHRKGDTAGLFRGVRNGNNIKLKGGRKVKEEKIVGSNGSLTNMNAGRVVQTGKIIQQKIPVSALINENETVTKGKIGKGSGSSFVGKRLN